MAKPFVKQTWIDGFDEKGRPLKNPEFWPKPMGGIVVSPGTQGGTNWYPPSYSPRTGLFYRAGLGQLQRRVREVSRRRVERGVAVYGIDPASGHRRAAAAAARRGRPAFKTRGRRATAPSARWIRRPARRSGTSRWSTTPSPACSRRPVDLVFAGGMEGNFFALDARTGERLWHVNLGGPNASGPISYAVDGKQYIVGTGAGAMFVFSLPE